MTPLSSPNHISNGRDDDGGDDKCAFVNKNCGAELNFFVTFLQRQALKGSGFSISGRVG